MVISLEQSPPRSTPVQRFWTLMKAMDFARGQGETTAVPKSTARIRDAAVGPPVAAGTSDWRAPCALGLVVRDGDGHHRIKLDSSSLRQRSSVLAPMATSRATFFIAALSGGYNAATALHLNACPYLAKSLFPLCTLFIGVVKVTNILAPGGRSPARRARH